LYSSL
jgi:hypothetical protein